MSCTRRNLIGISFHQAIPTAVHKLTTNDKHCHFIGRVRESEPFYIPAARAQLEFAVQDKDTHMMDAAMGHRHTSYTGTKMNMSYYMPTT